jgi:hypothetical protein
MAAPLVTRSFTVDEYHRMAEVGILHEDDRVELLDGRIVQMTPIGSRHAGCVKHLNALLYRRLGDAIILGIQDPVILGSYWEPQPDIAVLKPRADAYRKQHPRPDDVLLIVEVGDSSVASDRETKVPAYAGAGIGEVWLVDLEREQVEVYRAPGPRGYQDVRTLTRGESVSALLVATGTIEVAEILGPMRG